MSFYQVHDYENNVMTAYEFHIIINQSTGTRTSNIFLWEDITNRTVARFLCLGGGGGGAVPDPKSLSSHKTVRRMILAFQGGAGACTLEIF